MQIIALLHTPSCYAITKAQIKSFYYVLIRYGSGLAFSVSYVIIFSHFMVHQAAKNNSNGTPLLNKSHN